jgi:hypothetical protein
MHRGMERSKWSHLVAIIPRRPDLIWGCGRSGSVYSREAWEVDRRAVLPSKVRGRDVIALVKNDVIGLSEINNLR